MAEVRNERQRFPISISAELASLRHDDVSAGRELNLGFDSGIGRFDINFCEMVPHRHGVQ